MLQLYFREYLPAFLFPRSTIALRLTDYSSNICKCPVELNKRRVLCFQIQRHWFTLEKGFISFEMKSGARFVAKIAWITFYLYIYTQAMVWFYVILSTISNSIDFQGDRCCAANGRHRLKMFPVRHSVPCRSIIEFDTCPHEYTLYELEEGIDRIQ